MWKPNIKPTPLTVDSLKPRQKRRLERFSEDRIPENLQSSHPDPCLKSGGCLPVYRRLFFTPELINVPLEDLDPFYGDKETFVIVTENKLLHRFSAQIALNIFSPFNPVRRTCISVLHHWIYRWFVIMTAFVDCCLLIQLNHDHQLIVFYFFGATYTLDFVTNVIARGLIFDQFTFLRDGWGNVDLILLVPYFIPSIGRHHFLCGLRSLKITALIPSLKSMVKVVLKTVSDLLDMFMWTLFATWIFALVGYHFYMGVTTQTCVRDFPEDGSVGKNRDLNWHAWISNSSNSLEEYGLCGNYSMSRHCPPKFTCLQVHVHVDRLYSSMGWALLSTVQIMQQDSWDGIYFKILRSGGAWHALYFIVTLYLGSFYTLNMSLAVVSKTYDDIQKELKLAEKLESSRHERSTSNISCSNDGDMEENDVNDPDDNNHNDNSNAGLSMLFKCLDLYFKKPINHIWTLLTNLIKVIAFDPFTELIMAITTVANLVFLSMDHYGVEENRELYMHLRSGHQIFGIMFAVECLLKILACGPTSYFKDKWNIFDFCMLLSLLVELTFELEAAWMVLLCLNILRIFKLARIWPTLDSMLNQVFSVMGTVSDMTLVAIGVFYMFCVAGVHLFGGKIGSRHPKSHWHFRDFWHSFMVIFRLLCGEWVESMSECVDDHGWICIPFFASAVVVLDLIVLNLLLVMFLQRFSAGNLSKNRRNGKSNTNKVAIAVNRFKRLWMWMEVKFGTCLQRKASGSTQPVSTFQEEQNNEVAALVPKNTLCRCPKLRTTLQIVMNSKWFKYFNIGITLIATICLSLRDADLKSRPLLQDVLNVAENVTLFFMGVEAAIKIVAMGFSAYLKIKWNRLDFFIVLAGILNIITAFAGYGTVAIFRSMRVLRLFSNFEGTRILFNSLGRAMPKIFGILLVCLLIWLVFAIIGVQFLNGRLHFCYDVELSKYVDARIIRSKRDCLALNFTWANDFNNFDNVEKAYFRVLEIITFKGWTHTFDMAINAGETDENLPSFEKNFWVSGYFVAVVLFGSFFAFNLFTGVLIDGLNEEKAKSKGNASEARKENYHETRKYMLDKLKIKFASADIQMYKYQKCVLWAVKSKQFEIFILLNYGINMVLLTAEPRSTNAPYMDYLRGLNGICTAVFASECLLNMLAHKGGFFRNPCKMFELSTELISVFDIFWTDVELKTSLVPFRPGLLRLGRFAWISRLLRHIKAANGLRQLISVLQISLPAFFNICVLLFLVTFIYATLAMEIFKGARFSFSDDLNNMINFNTLLHSLISLFPIITSAGWDVFLRVITKDVECMPLESEREIAWYCGNATVAKLFVISYMFITFVILVNMFSAVILENYSEVIKLVECELGDEHFDMFYEVWSQFDTKSSEFIGFNHLCDLFERFELPFQVSKPNSVTISLMNIPIYEGNVVHCADVLDAAITYFYFRKGVVPAESFNHRHDEMKNEKSCKLEIRTSTFLQKREQRCAIIIQRAWRNQRSFLDK